ncbi:histone H2B-like [Hyla sarda]|uniref:histone H2B-like n=1 Tax=Hyla sarda TaxID=327740 RepID=UPI0024C36288|nr:histone H2B-like [Hyla sarda]
MKPIMELKSARRSCMKSGKQKTIQKSTKNYKKHLVRVLDQAQQTTSQQLWALDVLTREVAHADSFPLVAAEAARLCHYKPRRAITSPEICSALRALERVKMVTQG